MLIRVVSTYGVGGFAMIEARDSGESSIAGGADTDIRPVEGWVGGDTDADAGTGVLEDGAEACARFSLFGTARGIGTGREEPAALVCDFRFSLGVACVVGAALVVFACPLEGGIKADSDSNFGTSKKTGDDGGAGGGSGFSMAFGGNGAEAGVVLLAGRG
jgi:hypothetical protein